MLGNVGIDGGRRGRKPDAQPVLVRNHGVRRAYPVWNPIVPNEKDFVPESADAKLPSFLSDDERARLIRNGTYKADCSVNMETAQRLGWDKVWKTEGRPLPQRTTESSSSTGRD
jgi:hypothetical protein